MLRFARRRFLLATGALASPALTVAQAPQRRPRVGYLLLNPVTDPPSRERQGFLDGLREHGYVPGRNVEVDYASAEGEREFMDAVARELVARRPDLIVVSGEPAAIAAARATTSIPIVLLALGDPTGVGIVTSLARPGGNVTGVSFLSSDLTSKRLQFALECVPHAKRMTIVRDLRNANAREEARAAVAAAERLGVASSSLAAADDRELELALSRTATERPDLLYVTFEGGLAASNRTRLAEFGLRQRIPVVSGWHFLTEAGALLSYAPDIPAMFRRAAYYVDRILKGARPGDLPIELPTKFDLVLNRRTADALGLRFPQDMLLRAERVIE